MRSRPVFLLTTFLLLVSFANARCIDIFYDPSCPHCQQALSFLYNISDRYNLTINEFNVENPRVLPLFDNLSKRYNTGFSVPLILVNNTVFVGFAYGNATTKTNATFQLGYSNAILSAIEKSGPECPSTLAIDSIACSANEQGCATIVTPEKAKSLLYMNSLTSAGEYAGIGILTAILLFLAYKRRHAK